MSMQIKSKTFELELEQCVKNLMTQNSLIHLVSHRLSKITVNKSKQEYPQNQKKITENVAANSEFCINFENVFVPSSYDAT